MSVAARCVGGALRPFLSQSSCSRAVRLKMKVRSAHTEPSSELRHGGEGARHSNTSIDASGWSPDPSQRRPTDRRREEYFSRLFDPLKFPPELAHRTLTHNSHSMARQGHNAALSFIGRRVIAAYFMLFLHSSRRLKPTDDVEDIAARSLNTLLLGEYVGNEWGVGRELVWAPSISEQLKTEGHLPGLYKVQGETVQAIMGAIYHQFGGVVTHRVFHTRLLPLLLVDGGIPSQFHKEVLKISNQMGGKEGPLHLGKQGP